MAPADSNWLSFSLSSMEMLASSQSPHQLLSSTPTLYHHQHHQPPPSQHFLLDNFYPNEWVNAKAVEEMNHDPNRGFGMLTGYLDPQQIHNQTTVPKLEDFLGGDTTSSLNTQDSSTLTHIYDPNASASTYFNDVAQDLKEIALPAPAVLSGGGFQAFSANSGSDVDDSASIGRGASQLACAEFVGQAIESHGELGFSSSQFGSGALSLTVAQSDDEKAIVVAAESSAGKKVADTFGQRTSIYRGVTRHRWTGRYEAHLWDNSCRREGQARKGRQGSSGS